MDVRSTPRKAARLPQRLGSAVIDHPVPILVVVGLLLISWYLVGTRSQEHHVKAAFSEALNLYNGLDVQIDGIDVGKINDTKYEDGRAIVTLGIEDDGWPLPRGTTATIRYGTTLGNGTRIVQLEPGPKNGPELAEDAIIPVKDTVPPTEFDQIFNTFNERTRGELQSMLRGTADTFDGRSDELATGLGEAAPGLDATGALMSDLHADDRALQGLVANGHRATRTLAARRPEISNLMTVMAATFDEFASNARSIRASLDRFAPTLQDARGTLARLDTSVDKLDGLMTDLEPGAEAMPAFVRDARPALSGLARLAPLASSTVNTLRRSSPQITRLLAEGQPFSARLADAMSGLAPHIACVRPYAPEIAGFFTNWSSWARGYDSISHYARVHANNGNAAVHHDYPEIATDAFLNTLGRGMEYAMPRPPGLNDDKPYFLPECGAGPDALDPSKDPEDPR